MLLSILLLLFFLITPSVFIWLKNKNILNQLLSPVVLCYISGIIIGNTLNIEEHKTIVNGFCEISVVLSIPMILFSLNLIAWIKLARTSIIAYLLCIFSIGLSVTLSSFLFYGNIENMPVVGGMLAGCYTGGTPNLNAVGMAFNVESSLFPLLNTADAINSGIYLLFLTTFAHRAINYILPRYRASNVKDVNILTNNLVDIKNKFSQGAIGLTSSLICLMISLMISWFFFNKIDPLIIMICITIGGIVLSLFNYIRNAKYAYNIGQYFLLCFCVAIGTLSDISSFINDGSYILLFTSCILFISVIFHIALCFLFKIDADTMIITSTAGIFGPPFIGQVASAINNKEVIITGMLTGITGLAIGNFYGIFITKLLMSLF